MSKTEVLDFSEYCPTVVRRLQEQLAHDVEYKDSLGYLTTQSKYTQVLPAHSRFSDDVHIVDKTTKNALESMRVINWWTSPCPHLYPLHSSKGTNAAGLCEAASLAIWAINQKELLMETMRKTMNKNGKCGEHLYKRWLENTNKIMASDEDAEKVWGHLNDVEHDDKVCDNIHLFTLANILRRPIVTFANNNYGGIYLPLLWSPSDCSKSPLTIGHKAGFVPLLPMNPDRGRDFVPIVRSNLSPMTVHCLLQEEKKLSEKFLEQYLDVQQHSLLVNGTLVPVTVARLNILRISHKISVIENYLDNLTSCDRDMETFILADRWAQLGIGFPPMDWYLPNELSIYNYLEEKSKLHAAVRQREAESRQHAVNKRSEFFKRGTVETADLTAKVEPEQNIDDIRARRFTRKNTLSDMAPGFGGRRGALIGGDQLSDDHGTIGSMGVRVGMPVLTMPHLNTHGLLQARPNALRFRKRSKGSFSGSARRTSITEEPEEPDDSNPVARRLMETYHMPAANLHQEQGFVADRAALRAKDRILQRQASLSEFILPF